MRAQPQQQRRSPGPRALAGRLPSSGGTPVGRSIERGRWPRGADLPVDLAKPRMPGPTRDSSWTQIKHVEEGGLLRRTHVEIVAPGRTRLEQLEQPERHPAEKRVLHGRK